MRSFSLLLLCCLAPVACSDSSSTRVVVKVDNSIDDSDDDPNLVIGVLVRDDDDEVPVPAPAAARLQGAVRSDAVADVREDGLAYLALSDDGSPRGVISESKQWIGSEAVGEPAELSWSFDGSTLFAAGGDQLRTVTASGVRSLIPLEGASAVDGGPALEMGIGGEATVEVLAAIGRGPDGFEDVFAIYVDSTGRALGLENLTQTPEIREIDAAWLHDGARLAVLERSDRDAISVRNVVFSQGRELPAHAELQPERSPIWEADAGTLRDVSAARTRDLLAISAWTGRDWDVLCVDARGNSVNLGTRGRDEIAPSWSRDDRLLAVEQPCSDAGCGPLPIALWELGHAIGSTRCPVVSNAKALAGAGALPAWQP
jgi:hypothetical protein